ncbi:hypothetical protein ANOBCDAF_00362 [Pleomorphomonas sp. T1.2MG-36]|uniref:hypothetical protein n=1 Tax=Pleomorphomonas sp. T1.2MG-36 TaxID=3041167 RepID=UPI0024778CC2|nr:hypothetical protein [Pleomorphomonas sp. T1.2MG-36]CAI9399853.1 hypothetical protein ANOBCDAF_00362 [Pleomorphomonas sp. T1.2MG-36]
MTAGLLRLAIALATLAIASPASTAERRHQFIEPIQPDRRQQENATPAAEGKLCYCRTVHERNSVGRLTWKVVCSERKPERGARQIRARDCGAIRSLPPL